MFKTKSSTRSTREKNQIDQVKKALAESERRANHYLSVANVMIISLDKKGNIVLFNKRAEEVIGRTNEAVFGKNWFDLCIPKNIQKEVKTVFNKIINGKLRMVEHFENSIVNRKGEERLISWFNSELKNENGEIIGLISSGQDITIVEGQRMNFKKLKKNTKPFFRQLLTVFV